MFEKLKKIFKNREEKEKHNYDLTFDNVAIPEVHVKSTGSTRIPIKKMHLSAMTMLPYLRCISETSKINKPNKNAFELFLNYFDTGWFIPASFIAISNS